MSLSSKPQEESFQDFEPPAYIKIDQFTSAYYQDPTQEEYAINRAFQANNYNYIRKLPEQFRHGEVLSRRMERVRDQVGEETESRHKPYEEKYIEHAEKSKTKQLEKIGTLGFFELFPYRESPYGLAKELTANEHFQKTKEWRKISQLDFRPSGAEKKGKHQDPFKFHDKLHLHPKDNSAYIYPFHLPGDTFDAKKESKTRQRIVSQALRLSGPFLPSMKEKTLGDVHKTKLDDILTDVQFALKKSMNDYAYIIGVNKKDHIEILFEDIHQKDLKLKAFMSTFCQNPIMTKYKLRRDLQNWGVIENKYILFTIIPPWVCGYSTLSTLNNSQLH